MNISKRAREKSNYHILEISDNVRLPFIHKNILYKYSLSMDIHKQKDINRALYTVYGSLQARND